MKNQIMKNNKFKRKIYILVGDEYCLVSNYENSSTKVRLKHNKCGTIFLITPRAFFDGYRHHKNRYCACPICRKIIRNNKKNNQFKLRVKKLRGEEYSVLSRYKTEKAKIIMRHNKCGFIYKVTPEEFLSGYGLCPVCDRGEINDTRSFKFRVKELVGNEYTVLGHYKNSNTKIKMRHNKCGYIFSVRPYHFFNGKRCPKCCKGVKRTQRLFMDEVYDEVGNEYSVLGKYIDGMTKIKMKHNRCNHIFYMRPEDFLIHHNRCPYCYNHRYNTDSFKRKVKKLVGNEYTVLGCYKNVHTKIKMRHNKCGFVYFVTPNDFLAGRRCPHCQASHGELLVEKYLESHHYIECANAKKVKKHTNTFTHSYHIRYNHHLLSYDFLVNINNDPYTIEFDGAQHFRIADFSRHYYKYIKNHTLAIKEPKVYHKLMNKLVMQNQHDIRKEKWSLRYLYHPVIRVKNPKNLKGKKLRRLVKSTLDKTFKRIDASQAIGKLIKLTKNW